jgi:hypothetical protein
MQVASWVPAERVAGIVGRAEVFADLDVETDLVGDNLGRLRLIRA